MSEPSTPIRVIDLPGVVDAREFLVGWKKGSSDWLNGVLVNRYDFTAEFQAHTAWGAGFHHAAAAFGRAGRR